MKFMRILLIVVVVFSSFSTKHLLAQTQTNDSISVQGLIVFNPVNDEVLASNKGRNIVFLTGLKFGITTGSGIVVGADNIFDKWSLDLSILPFSAGDTKLMIVGSSIKFSMQKEDNFNLYLNTGLSYNYYTLNAGEDNRRKDPLRIGLGFGYMQYFSKNFSYDIQILGTYFANSRDFYPLPQVSINYHFK